jgi:DNA-3-methyladenine glycosylase I
VRCFGDGDPLYAAYHDQEWGRPVTTERGLYEKLCLEAFQSGLAWITILRKREAFREAFAGFDPDSVARFGDADVERLLGDAGIVRNRAKIRAAITNASATLELRARGTPLPEVVWRYRSEGDLAPRSFEQIPATTDASTALARELKKAGFAFVGPTTVYAMMQACGVVNDHLAGCDWRDEVEALRQAGAGN